MGVTKRVIQAGSGPKPTRGANITVHCIGKLESGKQFWSTRSPVQPFSFRVGLGQVIRGWDEGMLDMQLGERAELTMTGDYAYGAQGFPAWGIPPNATLIFDVEILRIE
eukprot:gnl/Trimastix_PCT/1176.p2 GENE.gnl/Trimastix_PCT/1176~~gnl/Trimastix_PCT/1176.p2  ORF type:complete len:125 (-),score=34.51 gnl/Trimastix_PCT/1176:18-344(-)